MAYLSNTALKSFLRFSRKLALVAGEEIGSGRQEFKLVVLAGEEVDRL